MGANTPVNTVFRGEKSDDWYTKSSVRHGGVCSGILFNFYLINDLNTTYDLPVGCTIEEISSFTLGLKDY